MASTAVDLATCRRREPPRLTSVTSANGALSEVAASRVSQAVAGISATAVIAPACRCGSASLGGPPGLE